MVNESLSQLDPNLWLNFRELVAISTLEGGDAYSTQIRCLLREDGFQAVYSCLQLLAKLATLAVGWVGLGERRTLDPNKEQNAFQKWETN